MPGNGSVSFARFSELIARGRARNARIVGNGRAIGQDSEYDQK